MAFEHITVSINGPIATLAFNRPRVLNAFHNDLMHETLEAMRGLLAWPHGERGGLDELEDHLGAGNLDNERGVLGP